MMTTEELKNYYNKIIQPSLELHKQYLITRRDFNNENLINAREELRQICNQNNIDMIIIPEGENHILQIQTTDKEIVLVLKMGFFSYIDAEIEYEFKVVRENALANPSAYGGRYSQKEESIAKQQFLKDRQILKGL